MAVFQGYKSSRHELEAREREDAGRDESRPAVAPGKLTLTALRDGLAELPTARRPAPGKVSGVRRKASGDGIAPDADEALARAASGPGRPLPESLRAELERALGRSLERVRLHVGAAAAEAARALSARAFARGAEVFFGLGEYDPGSIEGRRLIAHEVAHTVQAAPGAGRGVSEPGDADERAADRFADAFAGGGTAAPVEPGTAASAIRRYSDRDLQQAAEYRAMFVHVIRAAEPREARGIRALLLRAKRGAGSDARRGESLVSFSYQSTTYQVRYEDLDFLIARAERVAQPERREEPRQQGSSGDARESGDERPPPPPQRVDPGPLTPAEVEREIERTRAFGPALNRLINQRLRSQGITDLSDRIHYLEQDEFRRRYRAHLTEQFEERELSAEIRQHITDTVEGSYGYNDPETLQIYLDRESAQSTNALHEAIHLLEHQRFIRATEDPSHGDPPPHRTPFHEAVTSYLTSVIARENNIRVAPDYHPAAIDVVARLARRVGDGALLRAYMSGDLGPVLSQVPLLDQLLIGYYRGDGGLIADALRGVERR